jgi:hypothetical protein
MHICQGVELQMPQQDVTWFARMGYSENQQPQTFAHTGPAMNIQDDLKNGLSTTRTGNNAQTDRHPSCCIGRHPSHTGHQWVIG